jgi:hypothetical protein
MPPTLQLGHPNNTAFFRVPLKRRMTYTQNNAGLQALGHLFFIFLTVGLLMLGY